MTNVERYQSKIFAYVSQLEKNMGEWMLVRFLDCTPPWYIPPSRGYPSHSKFSHSKASFTNTFNKIHKNSESYLSDTRQGDGRISPGITIVATLAGKAGKRSVFWKKSWKSWNKRAFSAIISWKLDFAYEFMYLFW